MTNRAALLLRKSYKNSKDNKVADVTMDGVSGQRAMPWPEICLMLYHFGVPSIRRDIRCYNLVSLFVGY